MLSRRKEELTVGSMSPQNEGQITAQVCKHFAVIMVTKHALPLCVSCLFPKDPKRDVKMKMVKAPAELSGREDVGKLDVRLNTTKIASTRAVNTTASI